MPWCVKCLDCQSFLNLKHLVIYDCTHALPQLRISFKDSLFVLVICKHFIYAHVLRHLVSFFEKFNSVMNSTKMIEVTMCHEYLVNHHALISFKVGTKTA